MVAAVAELCWCVFGLGAWKAVTNQAALRSVEQMLRMALGRAVLLCALTASDADILYFAARVHV